MCRLSNASLVVGKVLVNVLEVACVIALAAAQVGGSLSKAWARATESYAFDASLLDVFCVCLARIGLTLVFAPLANSNERCAYTPPRSAYLVFDATAWIYLVVKFVCVLDRGSADAVFPLVAIAASGTVFTLAHLLISHARTKLPIFVNGQERPVVSQLDKRLLSHDSDVESGDTATTETPITGDAPLPMSPCKKACRIVCTTITCLTLCALSPLNITLLCCCCCKKKMCGDTKEQAAKKKEQKRKDQLERVQSPHPDFPFLEPGNGAPLLTGVRVVELATVIAGPSAGRIFADHGAEVIRVEPPSGTMWRRYLNFLERDRKTFVTSFEHVNFNKSSVVIDISTDSGLVDMKRLLDSADVFITNVRLPALKRVGLDYASLKNSHAHLVYGHLSAWGLVGPDEAAPGYDFGAFWAQTGMASLMNSQGHFSQYPGAFGDTVGGSALVGGLATGLRERLRNGGFGCFVEGSLLRTGIWVMAPLLLRNAEAENREKGSDESNGASSKQVEVAVDVSLVPTSSNDIPKYRDANDRRHCTGSELADSNDPAAEMYEQFLSKDMVRFAILALGPTRVAMQAKHAQLMETVHEHQSRYHSTAHKPVLCGTFREYASCHSFEACAEVLTACNVPFRRSCDLMSNKLTAGTPSLANNILYTKDSRALIVTDITPDLKAWVRPPFDFSCAHEQDNTLKRRAPELGAQTAAILGTATTDNKGLGCGAAFKLRPKNHKAALPRPDLSVSPTLGVVPGTRSPPRLDSPLSDVVVVELSGIGQSVSAACTQLCDQGASVFKVLPHINGVPQGKDALDTIDPFFGKQLNRGKILVQATESKGTASEVYHLLKAADASTQIVFATNLPLDTLNAMGLDESTIRKELGITTRGKALIYVSITACGKSVTTTSIATDSAEIPESKNAVIDPSMNNGADEIDPNCVMSYPEGSLGAFFQGGMLSDVLGNGSLLPVACPFQFGEMLSSVHCKTAIDLALFHHARTGEGQRVDLNLLRCGVYANLMFTSMSQKNPKMGLALRKMSFDSYQTQDGKWVQLLGVDYKTHVPRVLKALGIASTSYKKVAGTFFSSLPFFQSPMEAVPLLFGGITDCIGKGIKELTWAELQCKFDKHNVWYTTVSTPIEVLSNEQAHATLTFRWPTQELARQRDISTVRINSPIQLYSWKQGGTEAHVYGEPDSTEIVGPIEPKKRVQ